MLKNVMLALVPLTMLAASVKADDDLSIDVASIADADVSIVEAGLDIDVDQLTAEAGTEDGEDAIEACFRRFGYGYRGYRGTVDIAATAVTAAIAVTTTAAHCTATEPSVTHHRSTAAS